MSRGRRRFGKCHKLQIHTRRGKAAMLPAREVLKQRWVGCKVAVTENVTRYGSTAAFMEGIVKA